MHVRVYLSVYVCVNVLMCYCLCRLTTPPQASSVVFDGVDRVRDSNLDDSNKNQHEQPSPKLQNRQRQQQQQNDDIQETWRG